jgi:Ca2+-binding EF-hand superfamily protein
MIGVHRSGTSENIGAARAQDPAETNVTVRLYPEPDDPAAPFEKALFHLIPVLRALDRNDDQVLSPSEIANASQALAGLDLDHDGKLSADECGAFPVAEGPAASGVSDLVQSIMRFDQNHDGRIQEHELPQRMRSIFSRADVDHDGVLTPAEIAGLAGKSLPERVDAQIMARARKRFMSFHPVLAALDSDHDGEISAGEIRAAATSLRTMDRNRDGWLVAAELLPGTIDLQLARVMVLDRDVDGRITPEERANPLGNQMRQLLDSADRNRDGVVSIEELKMELHRRSVEPNSSQPWR